MIKLRLSLFLCLLVSYNSHAEYRATDALGIIIERAKASSIFS